MATAAPADTEHLVPALEKISASEPAPWSLLRRIVFRFGFVYWLLFCVPILTNQVEFFGSSGKVYGEGVNEVSAWVGKHVLGVSYEIKTAENGSGDKTVDYLSILCFAVIALMATLVWSIANRRARHHARLRELLHIVVRYTLAFVLLYYGVGKLFQGQFSPPSPGRLLQPYGESSPMGLLWTFMGASPAYVMFSGAAETAGAVLLLFRRTTMLGALILATVLTNVVMLNLCYDVPVKINSSHYLAMCLLLPMPHLRRLGNVLLFNRSTEPMNIDLELPLRWQRVGRLVLKYGSIVAVTSMLGIHVHEGITMRAESKTPDKWYEGYFSVEGFSRNGEPVAALVTDATRWRRLRFQIGKDKVYVRWRHMDDSYGDLFTVVIDEAKQTLTITRAEKEKPKDTYVLRYVRVDADRFNLEGTIGTDAIAVELKRLDTSKMLLVSRGFHWINEVPFNR